MIRGEDNRGISQADMRVDKIEQRAYLPVDPQRHIHRFLAVRSKAMADVIVGRKTHGQHVSAIGVPKFLVRNRFCGERHQQVVGKRCVVECFIKRLARRFRAARDHVREKIGVA